MFSRRTMHVTLAAVFASSLPTGVVGEAPSIEKRNLTISAGVSLPRPRGGHAAGIVGGVPVIAGGNDWEDNSTRKVWLKDTQVFRDGKWTSGPDLPHALAYAAYAHDASGLYLAGGAEGDCQFAQAYRLMKVGAGVKWSELPPLPVALASASGAFFEKRFFCACGEIGTNMTNRVWSLDTSKLESGWKECRSVPGVARSFATMIADGQYLYLLGGASSWSPLTPIAECLRYDPKADRWERLKDLPFAGYAWSASPVEEGRVLLSGCADSKIRPDIWLLDLKRLSSQKVGDALIQTTTAPLLRISRTEWWLIGGEPDSEKHRTAIVTRIQTSQPAG